MEVRTPKVSTQRESSPGPRGQSRAADSSLPTLTEELGAVFPGFPGEVLCITGLCKNWQSSPWTAQMGGGEELAALGEKVGARVC